MNNLSQNSPESPTSSAWHNDGIQDLIGIGIALIVTIALNVFSFPPYSTFIDLQVKWSSGYYQPLGTFMFFWVVISALLLGVKWIWKRLRNEKF